MWHCITEYGRCTLIQQRRGAEESGCGWWIQHIRMTSILTQNTPVPPDKTRRHRTPALVCIHFVFGNDMKTLMPVAIRPWFFLPIVIAMRTTAECACAVRVAMSVMRSTMAPHTYPHWVFVACNIKAIWLYSKAIDIFNVLSMFSVCFIVFVLFCILVLYCLRCMCDWCVCPCILYKRPFLFFLFHLAAN